MFYMSKNCSKTYKVCEDKMGKSSGDRFYEHLKDVLEGAKDKEAMGLFITLAAQIHSISLMAKKEKGTFGNEEIDNFFSPEQWLSCALEYEAKTSRFIENGLMVKSPYEKAYDAIMQEIVTDKSARTTLGLAKLILMLLYNLSGTPMNWQICFLI